MSGIKSFVKRNTRISPSAKQCLLQADDYLYQTLPPLNGHVGLEIGFGGGESLLDIANHNPDATWIGVEVYEKGIINVIRQARELKLNNILLRVGDVCDILSQEIPEDTLDHVRIFFPDPWHKKKHHKRRLINKVFLDQLSKVLKSKGVVHIATDNLHYAEACIELINEHKDFILSEQKLPRPMTKFAKKAIEKGVKITDLLAVKQ